ncbi:hypothetical protein [Planctomicrobium sp. SH527]|uniref:hypothetical protein n=1 Tax=Planctomicrobium sp. SH527 TaxID=3448123 RepID=UPI003F5BA019
MKNDSVKLDPDSQDDLTSQEIILSFIVELLTILPVVLFIGWGAFEVSKVIGQPSAPPAFASAEADSK